MCHVMRNSIRENKGADQLHGNRTADQRLCFRYIDSSIPKFEISSLYSYSSSVLAQPGYCQTWSETPKIGFLMTQLILLALCTLSVWDGVSEWIQILKCSKSNFEVETFTILKLRFCLICYAYSKQLRSCRDGQLLKPHCSNTGRQFTSIKCPFFHQ